MRKEDFIVGKIYYTGEKESSTAKWYYCGHDLIIENYGLFQLAFDSANEKKGHVVRLSLDYSWKEYKEPLKGTRWMNVYSGADGNIFTSTRETKEQADRNRYFSATRIACIEVPWVEGQGL